MTVLMLCGGPTISEPKMISVCYTRLNLDAKNADEVQNPREFHQTDGQTAHQRSCPVPFLISIVSKTSPFSIRYLFIDVNEICRSKMFQEGGKRRGASVRKPETASHTHTGLIKLKQMNRHRKAQSVVIQVEPTIVFLISTLRYNRQQTQKKMYQWKRSFPTRAHHKERPKQKATPWY